MLSGIEIVNFNIQLMQVTTYIFCSKKPYWDKRQKFSLHFLSFLIQSKLIFNSFVLLRNLKNSGESKIWYYKGLQFKLQLSCHGVVWGCFSFYLNFIHYHLSYFGDMSRTSRKRRRKWLCSTLDFSNVKRKKFEWIIMSC